MSKLAELIRDTADRATKKGHKVKVTAYQGGARLVCQSCGNHARIAVDTGTVFGKALDSCPMAAGRETTTNINLAAHI